MGELNNIPGHGRNDEWHINLYIFSDDLVQMCVDYMREYPLLVVLMVGIPLFLLLSFIYLMKPESEKPRKQKKKKKDKEKDKSREKKE